MISTNIKRNQLPTRPSSIYLYPTPYQIEFEESFQGTVGGTMIKVGTSSVELIGLINELITENSSSNPAGGIPALLPDGNVTVAGGTNTLTINSYFNLGYGDDTSTNRIHIDNDTFLIQISDTNSLGLRIDDGGSKGFYYASDYSGGATARWLVDKGYVDSNLASASATITADTVAGYGSVSEAGKATFYSGFNGAGSDMSILHIDYSYTGAVTTVPSASYETFFSLNGTNAEPAYEVHYTALLTNGGTDYTIDIRIEDTGIVSLRSLTGSDITLGSGTTIIKTSVAYAS